MRGERSASAAGAREIPGRGERAPSPFLADLSAALSVLVRPRSTFAALRDRRPVLAPWIVNSAATVLATLLLVSLAQRAAAHLLADAPSAELAASVQRTLTRMKIVSVAAAPPGLLIRWALTALVLWAPGVLATGGATYRGALSIVAYAALPGAVGRGVDVAVAWFEGPEFTPELVPVISSASSLAAFLPAVQGPWAIALLERCTPFALWGLVLWVVGVRETFRVGWRRSVAVAVPPWAVLGVLSAAADVIARSALGALPGLG